MVGPNDLEAHDTAAPSQEPWQQPAATGFPVVVPPPQYDYVPWSTGLCDCCSDCKRFCITFWCPCVTFGQISEIVDKGATSCGLNGAIYCLISSITGCACCYSFFYRLKMRKQYKIIGNGVEDFVYHCCCESCALTQEYRELQNRHFNPSGGWRENVDTQYYGVVRAPTPSMAPVVEDGMRR